MRFEKLGRRLAIVAATLTAAAIGGSGTLLASRRRTQGPGRRPLGAGGRRSLRR
jgi:hypothetical protein